ncbi:MAG: class I SAM-dependent methyltransferase [Candidatus Sulfotelmatobacter sp.]
MSTTAALQLEYTGERVVPGITPEITFRESQMRYAFAARFVPGRIVLDIASGSGIGTDYLRRAGAVSCFGLDLNRPALRYARLRYQLPHLAACDATQLCLASESVDVIVSFETIEHLAEPGVFLLECERVLRPGGHFICSTPNREITRWDQENPFHLAEMSIGDFAAQVREVFSDCTLCGQGPVHYPFYIVKKKVATALQTFHLKQWIKRRLRVPVDRICSEQEFADRNESPHYAVTPKLPRWPNRARYGIVLARKCGEQN